VIGKNLPSQISEISMANSRQNIRKLVKDGFVIRQPHKVIARLSPENLIIDVLAWGPAFV
jgi:ribosomal protein L19E